MVSKGYAKIYKKYADPCPWASNFSGNISADVESSPIENSLSCPNFVLAGGKKYCLQKEFNPYSKNILHISIHICNINV